MNLCAAKCVLNVSIFPGSDGRFLVILAKLWTENALLTSYAL
jgi:hypothetical protein